MINKSKFDFSIKELEFIKRTDLHESLLKLEIHGDDVNHTIVNTIRRVCLDNVPTYAFDPELITIEQNTSITNNDQMRLRLSQIPIFNVDLDLEYIEDKYTSRTIKFNDKTRPKHPKEQNIEMYINITNTTNENVNVTTNDVKYLEDGEIMDVKYSKKYPILLIQLRPGETFKAHMKSGLATTDRDNIYSACSNVYYEEITDNKYVMSLESQGQTSEYVILEKAIGYIFKKLSDFEEDLKKKQKSEEFNESHIVLEYENEDHTFGELLNTFFQDHPKIANSGMSKPSALEKIIKIKIYAMKDDDTRIIEYLIDSIQQIKNIFKHILNEIKTCSAKSQKRSRK